MSMYPENMFFTSESVTEGHPDKFCDKISGNRGHPSTYFLRNMQNVDILCSLHL